MKDGEEAGLVITQNERFGFLFLKQMREGHVMIGCYRVVNGVRERIRSVKAGHGKTYLFLEGSEGHYHFYYGNSERELIPLALDEDGTILSTLVADGYVGSYLGMYASSCHEESDNFADFDWFRYELIDD